MGLGEQRYSYGSFYNKKQKLREGDPFTSPIHTRSTNQGQERSDHTRGGKKKKNMSVGEMLKNKPTSKR